MRNCLIAVMVSLAKYIDLIRRQPNAIVRRLDPVCGFRHFFGLVDTGGRMVPDEEWRRFLADIITPRFSTGRPF